MATRDIDEMVIAPLGGGQEVGRSCIFLQYKNRNILLDCGLHPGLQDEDSLPFFDYLNPVDLSVEIGDIDLILVTHFHLDHCAALPYFTEKTKFRGRIYMTHATKAIMKLLLADNLKLQRGKPLYSEQDLHNCIDKIHLVDCHQTVDYKGIRFTATAAGHVLGAVMFMIEIDGIRVLYTGDYSLEEDRHLAQAKHPGGAPPDVLIVESTFGDTNLPNSDEREACFTETVEKIVQRGGCCLIPVFALGRAQELLLILDDYWQANPHLQRIPVYYASKVASKALRVYQTFVNMMNQNIRTLMDVRNPFKLRHVQNYKQSDFDTAGSCVVMAAPGFLTSGISRQLFERWCDDERNGVIIAGYTIEGTLAHDLLSSPTEITCSDNKIKPRRCQIEHISFAAHVDFAQNSAFISMMKPDNIILVHGGKVGMMRLKEKLERDIRRNWPPDKKWTTVSMPGNAHKVTLRFPSKPISANVMGSAATLVLSSLEGVNDEEEESSLSVAEKSSSSTGTIALPERSVLVTENFVSKVVLQEEVASYTSCRLGRITQKLLVPIPLSDDLLDLEINGFNSLLSLLVPQLEELFDSVAFTSSWIQVQGQVMISVRKNSNSGISSDNVPSLLVEWQASPVADVVADAVVGTVMQVFSVPAVLRKSMEGTGGRGEGGESGKRRKMTSAHSHTSQSQFKFEEDMHSIAAKKMKLGLVDPSAAIPQSIKDVNDIKTTATKLESLKQSIMQGPFQESFSSIQLNTSGNKLIFRGKSDAATGGGNVVPEAYCFVLWNTHEGGSEELHDAVVQSTDEAFRAIIIKALASLG